MNPFFTCLIATAALLPAWSQCSSVKKQTFLVSDRYRDAAQYGSHLLLANSHGLVIRDLVTQDPQPVHIEALPGDITAVCVSENYVFASAVGQGVHLLSYDGAEAFLPTYRRFVSLPGLTEIKVAGGVLFAYTDTRLTLYRFDPGLLDFPNAPLPEIASLEGPFTQFDADDELLYVRRDDGSLHVYTYGVADGLTYRTRLTLGGNNVFYGMSLAGDRLVVDGLDGISWVTFTEGGLPLRTGSYYANKDGEIVLGSLAEGTQLYLRFADRIEAYRVNDGGKALIGAIPQEFQNVGHVAMKADNGYLHLLNQAPQRREWSLASYQPANGVVPIWRLDALFEELSAGGTFNNRVYLASNRDIYLVDVGNPDSLRDQEPVVRFDGNIQDMVMGETLLFVTAPVPNTGVTRVYAFSGVGNGQLIEEYRLEVSGSVSGLTSYRNTLAFVRYVRNTSEDLYEANVLYRDGRGFHLKGVSEVVALGGQNPFGGLQISNLGLAYLRDNQVFVYDDPQDLTQQRRQTFPRPMGIQSMVTRDGRFWIQTEVGIYLYALEGTTAVDRGHYQHWRGLMRLPNDMLLAQNVLRSNPGSFHLLSLEYDRLVNDRVDFSTSDAPLFLADLGSDILVGERASINIFQIECPSQDYVYLLPVDEDLEMDLNTVLEPTDVVTLVIYNGAGEVIGFQDLDPDLIDLFNGRRLPLWLFDYNSFETPTSFTLMASKPMAPVLSGQGASAKARFAYRVPPHGATQMYLPHFPKDHIWNTRLYLRNLEEQSLAPIQIMDPDGNVVSQADFNSGATEVVDLQGTPGAPWLRLQTEDLGNPFHGFSLFSDVDASRAAAVPLVEGPAGYLVVPHLSGRHGEGNWTGMVLANPHPRTVRARVVGYNADGVISRDIPVELPGSGSLVVSAEYWLAGLDFQDDTRWLVVVPQEPIMGMILYGNLFDQRLAGLPLSGATGTSLVFSGIRTRNFWRTELQVTNQDAVSATLRVFGHNGLGELVAYREIPIGPNENLGLDVAEVFGDLPLPQIGTIQTIRVVSTTQMSGFAFRNRGTEEALEAFSALIED